MLTSKSIHSQKHIVWLTLLTCCFSAQVVRGANVVLRKHATLSGSIIRLGDIADISATSTAVLKDLSSTPMVPAPAPGSQQFLDQTQVRDLLVARGIDVQSLRIGGAATVEIGERFTSQEVRSETSLRVTEQEAIAAIQSAIERYLAEESGHSQWSADLEIDQNGFRRLLPLLENLTVQGGRAPWTGRQQFQIIANGMDEVTIVQTTVKKIQPALFARRAIQRGEVIRNSDVEVRQFEDRTPNSALGQLDQVVGMEAARSISADSMILESHIRAPLQVLRGETVTVYARTGGVAVRTYASARQDGALGDLVQVETLDGEQRFAARVAGRRLLEVLATGAQAKDFASLNIDSKRR